MRSDRRIFTTLLGGALLLGPIACARPGPELRSKQTAALTTGITLAYLELGDPAGAPVIFLHGYTDTARSFQETAQALAATGTPRRILVLDQRGHGEASMPPAGACAQAPENCFRPRDLADDVLAFMDLKGIARASFVGHSMGSFVAQELALEHPGRVDSLVLLGTASRIAGNAVLQRYILDEPVEGSWRAGFAARGLTAPEDLYLRPPGEGSPNARAWIDAFWVNEVAAAPALLAAIASETAATRMGTWLGAARALIAVDNGARLEALGAPTLVLWATQDAIFPASEQDALLARLDVAAASCAGRYVFKTYGQRPYPEDGVADDIGHNLHWGLATAVARDIDAFLRTGEPTDELSYAAKGEPQRIVVEPHGAALRRSRACG